LYSLYELTSLFQQRSDKSCFFSCEMFVFFGLLNFL
jgi:hypothetical protein